MHDVYYADADNDWPEIDVSSLLDAIFKSLKPGGVLGIVDHNALAGADPAESGKTLHRIDPEVIKKDLLQAGFVFEEESDMLANPADAKDGSVFAEDIRRRTDRSVMRFRREK